MRAFSRSFLPAIRVIVVGRRSPSHHPEWPRPSSSASPRSGTQVSAERIAAKRLRRGQEKGRKKPKIPADLSNGNSSVSRIRHRFNYRAGGGGGSLIIFESCDASILLLSLDSFFPEGKSVRLRSLRDTHFGVGAGFKQGMYRVRRLK